MHRRLWPDTFVTDSTIAGVVKEVRRALVTHDNGEPLVRTAYGVGFAFTGTVHTGEGLVNERPRAGADRRGSAVFVCRVTNRMERTETAASSGRQ